MDSLFTQDDQAPVTPFSSYTPRVAIVTGGAQGLGYAISNRLADDGIDIAINSVVEELRKKGRRAIAVPGDVSSETDVIAIIEKTMVANAGIARLCSFLQTSVDTYDSVLGINARGAFMCFKCAALQMIKQGRGGRLIAASSIMGKQGSQNLTAYCASRFAVRGIVQTAAIELRRHGITVNAYAPGRIPTGICS
ncbi:NAD-binding protein [Fomitiporia mediterranea MF3/22]|uniref:NAD-binding protein n=1 Tax=Fomitiporia mediterranea (strain MF3/22) TaxID=694068 RepID=UPI0004407FD3|nr:NAD-binding protein [Fomitiporia mediterranea MF3/22]EJD06804.1 NAD-binding protein [Fomitiporia mediterranea MF3/22]